jgi:hypothetical protein
MVAVGAFADKRSLGGAGQFAHGGRRVRCGVAGRKNLAGHKNFGGRALAKRGDAVYCLLYMDVLRPRSMHSRCGCGRLRTCW